LIALLLTLACTPAAYGQSKATFQYLYDNLGQLIKVVDSTGNVVTYNYDPVGNLSSITRSTLPSPSVLAIFNFTPQQGAVGAIVTIQGQNFSSTPSADTVKFNGTVATVTSARTTSLTVTVPEGATTGPISVTVGSATAKTANNFTVLQIPSITSISPTSAFQGATVSRFKVTGLNLAASTFSFAPAFVPPPITASNVTISADGTSATMTLTVAANAVGSFTLVATNSSGSSSQLPNTSNTLTVISTNPSADDDGDGLTNIYEEAIGSNPLNPSTAGDGIPDGWALFFGLNPSDPTGGSKTAPDGLTYLQAFQRGLNPLIPTLVPPGVSKVFPADGATDYPTNGVVVVRFNEPLLSPVTLAAAQNAINAGLPPGSTFSSANAAIAAQVLQASLLRTCCGGTAAVPGTIQLLQGSLPVRGTIVLSNDGLSLVFAPTQPLSSSTTYTVLVQGVKGASGIQMTGTFQSSFTTGLTINLKAGTSVLTSPPNGATNVPTNAAFMVEFSKQVDPSTLTPQTFFLTYSVSGQTVPGMLQVDPSAFTASFVPQTPYSVGRTIFVQLTSGVLDITQNPFPAALFSFTTGFGPQTQGPELVSVSPANGATGVPTNAQVVAQFNEPLSVIGATIGLEVLQGSTPIGGAIALSNGNTQVTFTPALNPGTVYTIAATAQITDVAENPLMNPGNFTFTTGATADTTTPSVIAVSPANGAGGVATNSVVQVQFSKQIDPLTVTTADFVVFPQATGIPVPGTVAVSADGLTATFKPSAPLDLSTNYQIQATNGITDLEGHGLRFLFSSFSTGLGTATTALTVVQVSPPNGAIGVPVNPQVVVVVSAPVSAASVGSNAITVSAGGTPAAGRISLSSDRTTLTFTPSNLLAASTNYTVKASGFTDDAGNTVVAFTSTFTTGTSGVGNTTHPAVTAVSPANGATGVPVNSNIVLTFNEALDPATVNVNTIQIVASAFSGQLAGNYKLDATGTVVTFTLLSPLPGNATINVEVGGSVLDLSGNTSNGFFSSFTTAAGTDTTPPKVLMVSPANGAADIGLNAAVVLTFSKSLNRNTINGNTVGLLVNGNKLGIGILSVSADNRTVILTAGTLPASSAVTVVATTEVQDLYGNGLANFQSQFMTAAAFDTTHPSVVAQRPGNGATGVPLNSSVVLYVSEAMNASTVQGAVHVSQNGVLASGTTQVTDNGQVVVFTPSTPWANGALIQVFLDSTAQDTDGNALAAYQGSFTTAADTSKVAPSVVSVSPAIGSTGLSTKLVIDIGFNETLNPATVNTTTVTLNPAVCCGLPPVGAAVSLVGAGTIIQVAPNTPLTPNTPYFVQLTTGIQGTNGLALPFTEDPVSFTTGAGADTVAPTIVSVSPPNGSVNVGANAQVLVVFSKPINPLTVSGMTIALKGGGTTEVPDSISFSNNNQTVLLVPHAPFPDNTVMSLTISGVTDVAGNAVKAQATTFTTGTGPDVVASVVVSENPFNGATNVPLNVPITLLVSEPVDPGTVNKNTLFVYDDTTGQQVAGSYSVSADGRTINFLPSAPLPVSRSFSVSFPGIVDLSGNPLVCAVLCNISFTTGTTANTTGPSVLGVSPANGLTGMPINAQAVIQFSEPVDALTINHVTLSNGGTVNVLSTLTNANQTLTLVPVVPLNTGTTYTVTVTGVQDLSGNALTASSTTKFTTGAGADLTPPTVTTVSPASGATGVPTNSVIQLQFSKRVDPLTVTAADFMVFPQATRVPIGGTVAASADGLTATFTPSSALSPSTIYIVAATGGILDLEGQSLQFNGSSFLTGTL
jgi:YD repeat-containing protein